MEKDDKDTRYVDKLYGPPKLMKQPLQWVRYRLFDRDVLVEQLSTTKKYQELLRAFFVKELRISESELVLSKEDVAQMGADLLKHRPFSDYFHDHICPKLPEDFAREIWEDTVKISTRNRFIHDLRVTLRDESHALHTGLSQRCDGRSVRLMRKLSAETQIPPRNGNNGGLLK